MEGEGEKKRWGDGEKDRERRYREKGEGEMRDREDRKNIEQKLQEPTAVLGPAAVPGLRKVGVGDPATCCRRALNRWSTRAPGERVGK